MKEAKRLESGPVLSGLSEASDDLYAWASTRVAKDPHLSLEDLLEEMQLYGAADLAAEAAALMENIPERPRAGENPRLVVRDTLWVQGEPGQGGFELDGLKWRTWDYMEDIPMDEELTSVLGLVDQVSEKRQCVTKTVAAGILWKRLGRRPTLLEVDMEARALRLEQTRVALDASGQMGAAEEFVTPVEHELRVYAHDILQPHHERDFRSFAVYPVEALEDARFVVMRADVRGRLLIEAVIGDSWRPSQWTMFALIWKGHMVLATPPEDMDVDTWLNAEEVVSTPILGFSFFWHARHDQAVSAPGKISCRHCKPGRKAGETACELRRHSHLAAVATVAGSRDTEEKVTVRGHREDGLVFRELFARKGTLTAEWLRQGGKALEPVEVFSDPHNRRGYRREHDLLQPEVRAAHLQRAKFGGECGLGRSSLYQLL